MQKLIDQLSVSSTVAIDSSQKLPPVEQWHPALSGTIDITITRDGRWLHEGAAFTRDALIRLFASILRREGDDYFLVTPVEKWRITVLLAPLLVIDFDIQQNNGEQTIIFRTATGDVFPLDTRHPLRWVQDIVESGEGNVIPLVMVRSGLEAVLSRSVYYRLLEITASDSDGYFLCSAGHRIPVQ